jgi:DNA-binding transcriptional MerR regulator
MRENKIISALELAKKYKLSYQTVNYYTNLGLLKVYENRGNKRFYKRKEVQVRLEEISKLKRKGYPLRVICDVLSRNVK